MEQPSMTEAAGQDAMLDFLICWHLASGAERRPPVMAALRRRASRRDRLDGDGSGRRLWSWCTSVWLPGWMRAAGLLEEARAVEQGGGAMVPRARQAAREAAMRRTRGVPLVCTVVERARAFAAVDASGSTAINCCGGEGGQPGLAYVAARDAAYVALRDRVDLDRVVARLSSAALALVDGTASGPVPDALDYYYLSGDERETGRTDMPGVREPEATAPVPGNGTVVQGSRVQVRDADGEHEYTMVTRATAGAAAGCVSADSPVGRALLGRRRGEQVRVQTPGGVRLLTVVDVATPR
ncbi:MAG: transcription elongation factor GreA [Chloroflexota bacterium]|jgi:transcription elongation factor GreA|nr:transcription elongation factor GreA [Chloroflexota bacterium]